MALTKKKPAKKKKAPAEKADAAEFVSLSGPKDHPRNEEVRAAQLAVTAREHAMSEAKKASE